MGILGSMSFPRGWVSLVPCLLGRAAMPRDSGYVQDLAGSGYVREPVRILLESILVS